ncbi:MAG: hypothetical protein ACLQE9_21210 [Roseiarcus sp.]
MDILAGRLELGTITEDQASSLSRWISDDYVVIKNAIEEETLEHATRDLDKTYDGEISNLERDDLRLGHNRRS